MLQRRATFRIILVAMCAFTALVWGGVALMLRLTVAAEGWALWAIPLLPLAVAALVLAPPYVAGVKRGFSVSVKNQIDKDLQWLDEIF